MQRATGRIHSVFYGERFENAATVRAGELALGGAIGLLVQGTASELELRRHLAAALPSWAQPRVVVVRRELPRLRDGKADRLACLRLLEEAR